MTDRWLEFRLGGRSVRRYGGKAEPGKSRVMT